jgi:hypothetical protein
MGISRSSRNDHGSVAAQQSRRIDGGGLASARQAGEHDDG